MSSLFRNLLKGQHGGGDGLLDETGGQQRQRDPVGPRRPQQKVCLLFQEKWEAMEVLSRGMTTDVFFKDHSVLVSLDCCNKVPQT